MIFFDKRLNIINNVKKEADQHHGIVINNIVKIQDGGEQITIHDLKTGAYYYGKNNFLMNNF